MRRAFTLFEVIVALTIAGIIALAARAALVAGMDTEERVQMHATVSEGDARFRSLLTDALRHMTDSPAPGLAPFAVRDTVVDGRPSQTAEFYSRGLGFPAGTGAIFRIIVAPASGGLTITALRADGTLVTRGAAPSLAAMNVRAKTPAGQWLQVWPQTLQVPVAVALAFDPQSSHAPTASTPPLVVSTRLEDRP